MSWQEVARLREIAAEVERMQRPRSIASTDMELRAVARRLRELACELEPGDECMCDGGEVGPCYAECERRTDGSES